MLKLANIIVLLFLLFPFSPYCQSKSMDEANYENVLWAESAPNRIVQHSDKRIALVMGAANYIRPLASYESINHDVDSMAAVLNQLNFDVIKIKDGNLEQFNKGVQTLNTLLSTYDYEDCVFYFSGHGKQSGAIQYLIPKDFKWDNVPASTIDSLNYITKKTLSLHSVIEVVNHFPQLKHKLVLVDACRTAGGAKGGKIDNDVRWLNDENLKSQITIEEPNVYVLNSAKANSAASANSNNGFNSLFTWCILQYIRENNTVATILYNVACRAKDEGQVTAARGQLDPNFSFRNVSEVLSNNGSITVLKNKAQPNKETKLNTPQPGTIKNYTRNGITIETAYIPSGSFTMGSPENELLRGEDEVQHKVTLDAFYMSTTEVTFEMYDAYCTATDRPKPEDEGWGRGNRPVINVSWYDAKAFADFMGCRLPTEAEWEYACRSGVEEVPYSFGKTISRNEVNIHFDIAELILWGKTTPVKSFPANNWGLYDMHGNVMEWCSDWLNKYRRSHNKNPKGPSSGFHRVLRGGSFKHGYDACRTANRVSDLPVNSEIYYGFRVVCPL